MRETDLKKAREASAPHLSLREMARKLVMSHVYLRDLEEGFRPWSGDRRERYMRILSDWRESPSPTPRKPRTTKPKRALDIVHADA